MEHKNKGFWDRYLNACHAVQTGVSYTQQHNPSDGSPKHLRTGINMSKVEHAALVSILIKKGIFTETEYLEALALEAEKEVERYQKEIEGIVGKKVTLV